MGELTDTQWELLRKLGLLLEEHDADIGGCGCCGSPWVSQDGVCFLEELGLSKIKRALYPPDARIPQPRNAIEGAAQPAIIGWRERLLDRTPLAHLPENRSEWPDIALSIDEDDPDEADLIAGGDLHE